MTDRLEGIYERLKMVVEHRTDENGEPVGLLYRDIIAALRTSDVKDYEIVEALQECLIAHAFVGISVLNVVGGPQRMEIPVSETKELAQAMYYLQQVRSGMVKDSAMDSMVDAMINDKLEDSEKGGGGKEQADANAE